jgi:hypothetical protein
MSAMSSSAARLVIFLFAAFSIRYLLLGLGGASTRLPVAESMTARAASGIGQKEDLFLNL